MNTVGIAVEEVCGLRLSVKLNRLVPLFSDTRIRHGRTPWRRALHDFWRPGLIASALVLRLLITPHASAQVMPVDRGVELFLNNEMEAAKPYLESAIRQQPRNERLYLYLATAYEVTGDSAGAVETLQRGIQFGDEFLDVMYFNIGNNLFKQQMNILAFEMFTKAISVNPSLSGAYLNRANAGLRIDQFESAVSDYTLYLQLKPNDPQRPEVESVIGRLTEIIEEQRRIAIEEERARLAELARKQALLDQVRNSLQNASSDTTNLSARTEEVDRADEDADIVD